MMHYSDDFPENCKKKGRFILKHYKEVFLKYKSVRVLQDSIYLDWVNKVQVVLIFYTLCALGKYGVYRKKRSFVRQLKAFEQRYGLSTGIVDSAERMFL